MQNQIIIKDDIKTLISELNGRLKNGTTIIGIDGMMGSGKTKIAKAISQYLGSTRISLDIFLGNKHKGQFLPNINIFELKKWIKSKRVNNNSIIIEGICLLQVLAWIRVKSVVLIYIKRLGKNGIWYEETEACSPFKPMTASSYSYESATYHQEFEPVTKANIIYEKTEDLGGPQSEDPTEGIEEYLVLKPM